MTTTYILIDYENVQPKDVPLLNGQPIKLFVFLGTNQSKIPIELVSVLQLLGEDVQWVRMSGNGRNALDFHIALYLGELSANDPDGSFYVLSKDKGFDPVIEHLRDRKITARRFSALSELPIFGSRAPAALEDRVEEIVKNLKSRGSARPRKRKTLASTINAHFRNQLDGSAVEKLIVELERRELIAIQEGAVSFIL
jgi:hypothetical protein